MPLEFVAKMCGHGVHFIDKSCVLREICSDGPKMVANRSVRKGE